jgi:hypothetical protein
MNYEQNYYDYIRYVKTLNRTKDDGISYEGHHILPKSLGGTGDTSDWKHSNIVPLTFREHYLAHFLLWKFMKCSETSYAFWCMNTANQTKYRLNSTLYERCRIEHRKVAFIDKETGLNVAYKEHQPEETNRKRSETLKKRYQKQEHHRKGTTFKLTEEQIKKAAMSHAKRVMCIETGKVYETMKAAQRESGCHRVAIRHCIRGEIESVNGLHWKDAD